MTTEERYKGIIGWFSENVPVAETELHYGSAYELLVATILAAQCTDKRVNITTPALFERYPTPEAMAQAAAEDLFPFIKSISYPNNKAKNLAAMARMLWSEFGGVVPDNVEDLQKLPGVGRKTANVVASVVYHREVMAVDTHVFRVARRLGLTRNAKNPLQAEMQLTAQIPSHLLPIAHHWLILHGRYVCTARKPKCDECGVRSWCKNPVQQTTKKVKNRSERTKKIPALLFRKFHVNYRIGFGF